MRERYNFIITPVGLLEKEHEWDILFKEIVDNPEWETRYKSRPEMYLRALIKIYKDIIDVSYRGSKSLYHAVSKGINNGRPYSTKMGACIIEEVLEVIYTDKMINFSKYDYVSPLAGETKAKAIQDVADNLKNSLIHVHINLPVLYKDPIAHDTWEFELTTLIDKLGLKETIKLLRDISTKVILVTREI